MAFGLLPTGFVPKTLTDAKVELQNGFKALFGASINVAEQSNFGQFIGIMAERFAELWEVAQAVNAAMDPDAAEGAALVSLSAITGTIPFAAEPSTVILTLTGTNGTVLFTGRVVSVTAIGTKFETLEDVTITTAAAWTTATAYGLGARVTSDGSIFLCTIAGTSATAPTGEGLAVVDGTVTWRWLGSGTAYALAHAESQEAGAKIAVTNTLTVIETPISGWLSVTNEEDADLGREDETNTELRVRREAELLGASTSTIDSIRVRIANDVDNVTNVLVFQNDGESTDADGLPPHSVEVLVRGGDDDEITAAVFANVAAGITKFGNQSHTFTDINNGGQVYQTNWSRPVEFNIYIIANVIKDPNFFPADGVQQIKDVLVAYGDLFATGKNVVSSALKGQTFKVVGVLDVTTLFIGTAPAPASEATVVMTLRQLADFDSARITINVTDGIP